jgi:hypothetical protein
MVKVWAPAEVSSAVAHNTPVKKERMVKLLLMFVARMPRDLQVGI